jgi:hypothetical protein
MARSPLLFATDNETDPTGFHLTKPTAFQNVPSMARVAAGAFGFLTLIGPQIVLAVPI